MWFGNLSKSILITIVFPSLVYLCFIISCCCYNDLGFYMYLNVGKCRHKLDTKLHFLTWSLKKTSFQRCFLLNKQMGTTCFSQSLPQTVNYSFPSQISIRGSLKPLTAIKSCYCLYLLQIAFWNETRVFSLDYALPKALDYFVWLDPLFITKKIMVLNNKEFLDSWGVQIFNYFAKNFRTQGSW